MATVYEIIQGISQAAANAYDGSQYERYAYDGQAREVGLRREKGDAIVDSRVMDGFGVKFHGDKLIVNYHAEVPLKETHNKNFETDIDQNFADIVKFLKKEYKSVTGNALTLTPKGDTDILIQNMSRIRNWVQASKAYQIGGLGDVEPVKSGTPDNLLNDAVKNWLAIGKDVYPKAKKPKNVTRPKE